MKTKRGRKAAERRAQALCELERKEIALAYDEGRLCPECGFGSHFIEEGRLTDWHCDSCYMCWDVGYGCD